MNQHKITKIGKTIIIYSGKLVNLSNKPKLNSSLQFQMNRKLLSNLRLNIDNLVVINAVGKDEIIVIDDTSQLDEINKMEYDGIITTKNNLAIALNAADCIPLVLTAKNNKLLALIHVGFSGADAGIHIKAIQIIKQKFNIKPSDLIVYFGPHIKKESYKLKDLKQKKLIGKWQKHSQKNEDIYSIDLTAYVLEDLLNLGVKKENIEISNIDTYKDRNYFSHRRSAIKGEAEGRNGFVCTLE